jgi:hypothetical protein
MSSGFRALALTGAAFFLLACVSSEVSAEESGVSGVVTVTPARPGPQRAGAPGGKPLVGADVQIRDAGGAIVGRATTDADGAFRILAPSGEYQVHLDVQGAKFPRCGRQRVRVEAGRMAHLDLSCDSGMR